MTYIASLGLIYLIISLYLLTPSTHFVASATTSVNHQSVLCICELVF